MQGQSPLCIDQGSTWPLALPAPLEGLSVPPMHKVSLQTIVDTWNDHQDGRLGLVTVPSVLCLQVNRFNPSNESQHKTSVPVDPEPSIAMPVFSHDLQAGDALSQHVVLYHRAAFILHIGPSSTTGHYRCVLYGETPEDIFLTDDNQPACRASEEEYASSCCQSYVLMYHMCGPDADTSSTQALGST